MTPQLLAAIKRLGLGLVLAVIPLLLDFLATGDFTEFGQAGVLVAFMLARVLEGVYDGIRNQHGDVRPADVGATAAPVVDPRPGPPSSAALPRDPDDWPDPPPPDPITMTRRDGSTVQ